MVVVRPFGNADESLLAGGTKVYAGEAGPDIGETQSGALSIHSLSLFSKYLYFTISSRQIL